MFRPERMEQVDIIVAQDQMPNLLEFAGKNKLFHQIEIVEGSLPKGAEHIEATELLANAANLRNRTNQLVNSLHIEAGDIETLPNSTNRMQELARYLEQEIARIEKPVHDLESKEAKLQESRESENEFLEILSGLEPVGVSLESIARGGFVGAITGETAKEFQSSIEKELDQATYGNTIFVITHSTKETVNFLTIFPSAFENEVRQVLTSAAAKIHPPLTDIPADPALARRSVQEKLQAIEAEQKSLLETRDSLKATYSSKIGALAILSEILEVRARALSNASGTESTIVFRGWVPRNRIDMLTKGVVQATHGLASIHVEADEPRSRHAQAKHDEPNHPHHEHTSEIEPPTLIKVPAWAKSLQSVVDNFGLPSYGETNPLPFMLITFPVIFGLMFGDYGEGILFLALGLFLYSLKRRHVKVFEIGQMFVNGAELIIMLALSMIGFGLVFGDFFGLESSKIFGIPALFSPTHGAFDKPPDISNLLLFMVFVLFFGVAHYVSGLLISAYNHVRSGQWKEAFFGPIAWVWFYGVFIYLAILVVISGYHFSVLLQHPVEIILFVLPLGLLGYWEGGLHAFEVFISAGSNTLSYLRIWALNLADFAIKFAFISIMGPFVGLIAGNSLVMILEGLIVFVQTLRLHWVEWFSKFYEGTGQPFVPYQEPTGWIVPK